jgi:hypothetical protein
VKISDSIFDSVYTGCGVNIACVLASGLFFWSACARVEREERVHDCRYANTVEITDSLFNSNYGYAYQGSAVSVFDADSVTIDSNTFENNWSPVLGGPSAIYVYGSTGSVPTLTISNSSFSAEHQPSGSSVRFFHSIRFEVGVRVSALTVTLARNSPDRIVALSWRRPSPTSPFPTATSTTSPARRLRRRTTLSL